MPPNARTRACLAQSRARKSKRCERGKMSRPLLPALPLTRHNEAAFRRLARHPTSPPSQTHLPQGCPRAQPHAEAPLGSRVGAGAGLVRSASSLRPWAAGYRNIARRHRSFITANSVIPTASTLDPNPKPPTHYLKPVRTQPSNPPRPTPNPRPPTLKSRTTSHNPRLTRDTA